MTAGILYRLNFLYIKSWTRIPSSVSSFCHQALGWLLYSRPPSEGALPMGATLEIQRQQRTEYMEQRMLLAQAQRFRTVQRQNAFRRPVRQVCSLSRWFKDTVGPRPEAHMDMILFEVFLKSIDLIPQQQILQRHYLYYR